mmetsp:Transcript_58757/g.124610  ORF Transcript_58757/g.124610 Transcript_58757/m.124610 type:complete len:205 (-) Transcript_58757:419-1033(-)
MSPRPPPCHQLLGTRRHAGELQMEIYPRRPPLLLQLLPHPHCAPHPPLPSRPLHPPPRLLQRLPTTTKNRPLPTNQQDPTKMLPTMEKPTSPLPSSHPHQHLSLLVLLPFCLCLYFCLWLVPSLSCCSLPSSSPSRCLSFPCLCPFPCLCDLPPTPMLLRLLPLAVRPHRHFRSSSGQSCWRCLPVQALVGVNQQTPSSHHRCR